MKRIFKISGYPTILVFVLAGLAITLVAYTSVNLFDMSMANLHFLRQYGWLAISAGGLVQFIEIALTAGIALALFFVYKICETELVARYRRWQDK